VSVEAEDNPNAGPADDDGGSLGDDGEVLVLPWWRNPLNLIAILIGVLVLAGGAGFVIGERNATPDPNAVDIGFLQDMRAHHEQAVGMSFTYMLRPGVNGTVSLIAQEIADGQAVDSGRMIQLLREYGKPEANQTDIGMAWMGQPVPLERMPGLASDADLNTLASSTGTAADELFIQLMIVHHEAGILMAQYAADHAATSEVIAFAKSMVSSQQSEIAELQGLLAKIQNPS
jgi:uncharacterized protein (DUF305 family)